MVNTGVDVWRWKWTAPVATPGDITFNILTLKDNGLANGWDSLFVSAEVISPVLASLEEEEGSLSTISVWTDNNCLVLGGNVAAIEKIDLEMYSIGGQRVFQTNVLISDQAKVKLNGNLQTGVYIVHLKNRAGHTSLRKVYITSLY
jgi:hypothetical protein